MSKAHSPTRFNGEADNFYDPNFTLDIDKKMRVPKSIRVNGSYTDEDIPCTNNGSWNQIPPEKFEMHVPDRILVVGQEQHIGTKAPPREILLDNAVLPSEPEIIRVQTPPRILTLDNHYFPAVDEEDPNIYSNNDKEISHPRPHGQYTMEPAIVRHAREQTPSFIAHDTTLPLGDEVQHLRRQVGKLNRRIMAIEQEMSQYQQKEKVLWIIMLAQIIFKTLSWARSKQN